MLSDAQRPDMTSVALLMMSAQRHRGVQTHDYRPGAEPVDVTTTRFLRRGFALIAALDCAAMVSLPVPQGWRASLAPATRALTIKEHGVRIYTGQIDIEVPPDWYRALYGRGSVAVLVASNLPPDAHFMDAIDRARLGGTLVGATIPLAG